MFFVVISTRKQLLRCHSYFLEVYLADNKNSSIDDYTFEKDGTWVGNTSKSASSYNNYTSRISP